MNECEETLDVCGLGTCSNNDDGIYYECECQDGAMTTGSGGNLTCVGKGLVVTYVSYSLIFRVLQDINECEEDLDICGLGTCSNNDDGAFYECECQDGAMITGSSGNLTCVGKAY